MRRFSAFAAAAGQEGRREARGPPSSGPCDQGELRFNQAAAHLHAGRPLEPRGAAVEATHRLGHQR
eukprot:252818-Prorocentrum_minimum.AAC.2